MDLNLESITDSKKFWKTMKPFNNKGTSNSQIILIEDDNIISESESITETLNTFFVNAVPSLQIVIPNKYNVLYGLAVDPIDEIINNFRSILAVFINTWRFLAISNFFYLIIDRWKMNIQGIL